MRSMTCLVAVLVLVATGCNCNNVAAEVDGGGGGTAGGTTSVGGGSGCIATNYAGGAAIIYSEDVSITRDVVLQGKYPVTGSAGALSWNRSSLSADRSVIQNTNAQGLRFSGPVTALGGIDGIQVR